MRVNDKKVLIFPEYHLSDFPPQALLTKQDAYDILSSYMKFGFDILISGYVERDGDKNYGSCLVIDGTNTWNIRKNRAYKDEIGIITAGTEANNPIDLSIGLSLSFAMSSHF